MKAATALDRLKHAVIARTGHHYYADKDRLLYDRARERMTVKGLTSFEDYVALLETSDSEEWRRLEDVITIGETYFFRYPDHFAELRERVLPALIEARAATRSLRIWSIGFRPERSPIRSPSSCGSCWARRWTTGASPSLAATSAKKPCLRHEAAAMAAGRCGQWERRTGRDTSRRMPRIGC
jgi:hypothetical protein